jgi:dolichol-phosphate mannosyltransferase
MITAAEVVCFKRNLKVVYFLENKKSGLGTAYVHGFQWALENKYDLFLKWMLIFS